MTTTHDQLTLEEGMVANAKQRQTTDNLKASQRGEWHSSKLGSQYQRSLTKTFGEIVAIRLAQYQPGKPGSNARALKLLATSGLEPSVIGHLFVKGFLAMMPGHKTKKMKRVTVCIRVADHIHDEVRIRHFAESKERRNLLKKLFKQFDRRSYPREWRKRTILNYFHAEQMSWEQWTRKERLLIGYTLLLWFRDYTGLIDANRDSQYVHPAPQLLDHIEGALKSRVQDHLFYKPMVVKPHPWSLSNLFRGGYISNAIKPYPLVKRTGKRDIEELQARDWSQIIPAINAIQETPWRVNKTVLQVLAWAMHERRGGVAGLPMSDPRPLPPEPHDYRTNEETKKKHNRLCFEIHSINRETISRRLSVLTTIGIAEQFKNFDAIYFPHNLDSRGRAYPVPATLNPQGPEYCKALLEFSRGETIETQDQACWLAIHGANAYGKDKVSLQERVDWVGDNEALILSVADNPYRDVRWMEADEPFQFLRFCLEWKAFMSQGFGMVSHMVCHVDATCSGLQHYSAALRDEIGGRSVNLIPGLTRQDIYQDVADRVIEKLMMMPDEHREIAKHLITIGIGRADTKRQVMVVPYSGTFSSCLSYTREALAKKFADGVQPTWNREDKDEDQNHINMLASLIWTSIDEIVVKGKEAMTWLTKATRAYVRVANGWEGDARSKAIRWETPDGFLVRHYQADEKKQRVATYLDGRVDLVMYEKIDRLSGQDTAQAVAPNWVHSLDANLLRASVIRGLALSRPITSYGMIHDSFGVHAARMGEFLSQCVKPAFIAMYERDVLTEFRDALLCRAEGLEIAPLPEKGTLELSGVQESEFFFS